MEMKPSAPSLSRSGSPTKQPEVMPGIPEATPGPNAFAMQKDRLEKHRLAGNAFFQKEFQKRNATPPTVVHPALRQRSSSDPPSPGKPSKDQRRESTATTMSPFINAGKDKSPQLQLVPEGFDEAEPTTRGFIEERKEHRDWKANGARNDRTPVYAETPKTRQETFTKAAKPKTKTIIEEEEEPPKSPKKTLFERLNFSRSVNKNSPSPSQVSLRPVTPDVGSTVPPKAKYILGTSASSLPSKTTPSIVRSPSKKRTLFFRKGQENAAAFAKTSCADPGDVVGEPPVMAVKTPQTSVSDPMRYSNNSYASTGNRKVSKSISESAMSNEGAGNVASSAPPRSQSLQYFDKTVPPTPPTKDTPPDQKEKKGIEPAPRKTLHHKRSQSANDITPSQNEIMVVSSDENTSPTKSGSYAHKQTTKVVQHPSMYSMHAVVVNEKGMRNVTSDTMQLEEMVREMSLEGYGLHPESYYNTKASVVYSPSLYPEDSVSRPNTAYEIDSPLQQHDSAALCDAETETHKKTTSHTTKASTSSGGTITVCYPDLGTDPTSPKLSLAISRPHSHTESPLNRSQSYEHDGMPQHGRTLSDDHIISPDRRSKASLFAQGVPQQEVNRPLSPASYQHRSAMPSPLYLQPRIYVPPPGEEHKRTRRALEEREDAGNIYFQGLGISQGKENSGGIDSFLPRSKTPYDNVPQLSPTQHPYRDDDDVEGRIAAASIGGQPSTAKAPNDNLEPEKLDEIFDRLAMVHIRFDEAKTMSEDLKTIMTRIDSRLAAIGIKSENTPPAPYQRHGALLGMGASHSARQDRVDFDSDEYLDGYRPRRDDHMRAWRARGEPNPPASSIDQLMATNEKLAQLVGGLAERLNGLEKRISR